jgi:hypothetical protein
MNAEFVRRPSPAVLAALLIAFVAGCGDAPRHKVVPVEGTIAFADGRKLPAGTRLLFNPGDGSMGAATAVTAQDGTFNAVRIGGRTGVEEGKYTVLLAAPEGDNGVFFRMLPKDYYDGGVFAVEVREGMPPVEFKVVTRRR